MFWMVNNEFNEFYFILIFIVFVELYVYDNIVWLIVLYNNVYMVKILMREKKNKLKGVNLFLVILCIFYIVVGKRLKKWLFIC